MSGAGRSAAVLLLDLDGTLVDPAPGILGSVRHALTSLGRAAPPDRDLRWMIGPPLRESFARLLGGDAEVERAVEAYRAVYATGGLLEAAPYAGIHEALAALRGDGHRLVVCTAKPWPFARQVVAHFGFADAFEAVFGPELDGRHDDKGALVAHILAALDLKAGDGCMIGDRANDVLAARRNGMASIGVTWGYGEPDELLGAGATILCDRVADLPARVRDVLGRRAGDRPPAGLSPRTSAPPARA